MPPAHSTPARPRTAPASLYRLVTRAIRQRQALRFAYQTAAEGDGVRQQRVRPYRVYHHRDGHISMEATVLDCGAAAGGALAVSFAFDQIIEASVRVQHAERAASD